MSEVETNVPGLDPVQREAVVWVQRLVSGLATAEDAEALKYWCGQSAAHAAAFAAASRLWQDMGPATHILHQRGAGGSASVTHLRHANRHLGRRAFLGGGLAAAAAAAYAVIDPPLGLWPSFSELNASYRTATGEQRQVELADNVSIRMNTQTSLSLKSPDGETDRIDLIAGEAYFATMPGTRRPLMVLADGGRSIVRQARFEMRHLENASGRLVCVTCLDGQVRVEHQAQTVALAPGQQVRYSADGLGAVITVDRDIASEWQRGIVVFRATPLAEVVDEINRYRPGKIILMNDELGRKPVSGRFRIDQMNEILARLSQAFDARIETLPGGIALLS